MITFGKSDLMFPNGVVHEKPTGVSDFSFPNALNHGVTITIVVELFARSPAFAGFVYKRFSVL